MYYGIAYVSHFYIIAGLRVVLAAIVLTDAMVPLTHFLYDANVVRSSTNRGRIKVK